MLKFRKLLSEVQNMPISIIPDVTRLPETIEFSAQYHLGWEFNDFMFPTVLDNEDEIARLTTFINHTICHGYAACTALFST